MKKVSFLYVFSYLYLKILLIGTCHLFNAGLYTKRGRLGSVSINLKLTCSTIQSQSTIKVDIPCFVRFNNLRAASDSLSYSLSYMTYVKFKCCYDKCGMCTRYISYALLIFHVQTYRPALLNNQQPPLLVLVVLTNVQRTCLYI